MLLGYLQPDQKTDDDDSNRSNKNGPVVPTALTKAANGTVQVSELSMPPPRVGINGSRQQRQIIPSLLSNKNEDEEEDEDEVDLNPWEKK